MINAVYTVVNSYDLMKKINVIDTFNLNSSIYLSTYTTLINSYGFFFSDVLVMQKCLSTVMKKRIHMHHSLNAVPVKFVREMLVLTKLRANSLANSIRSFIHNKNIITVQYAFILFCLK